jgi:hypothetical protein
VGWRNPLAPHPGQGPRGIDHPRGVQFPRGFQTSHRRGFRHLLSPSPRPLNCQASAPRPGAGALREEGRTRGRTRGASSLRSRVTGPAGRGMWEGNKVPPGACFSEAHPPAPAGRTKPEETGPGRGLFLRSRATGPAGRTKPEETGRRPGLLLRSRVTGPAGRGMSEETIARLRLVSQKW